MANYKGCHNCGLLFGRLDVRNRVQQDGEDDDGVRRPPRPSPSRRSPPPQLYHETVEFDHACVRCLHHVAHHEYEFSVDEANVQTYSPSFLPFRPPLKPPHTAPGCANLI